VSVYAAARVLSTDWAARGACLSGDPDLFFPITSSGPALPQIAQAKAVCARCPVRIDCLSYALATGQDAGVWGGTTAEERREIRPPAHLMSSAASRGQDEFPA
jgi:WhiB family transcriptional regulator, redox-sensing transcriptional regulator